MSKFARGKASFGITGHYPHLASALPGRFWHISQQAFINLGAGNAFRNETLLLQL